MSAPAHLVESRLTYSGQCEDGHAAAHFDLIIGGVVHPDAALLHAADDQVDVYFEPPDLRDWLERDHTVLHDLGARLAATWREARR